MAFSAKFMARVRAFATRLRAPAAQPIEAKFNAWCAGRRFLLSDEQR